MKGVSLLFLTLLLFGRASGLDIEWVGSGSALSTGSATLSIPKPAGTSAGDLILIQAAYTTATGSITVPSGFTAYINDGANALEYAFCYRIADGTEGSSFSLSSTNTRDWIGSIAVYRNVNPGSPFEAIDYLTATMNAGDTSFVAPAVISNLGEGVHLIFGVAKHTGTPASISAPSGMTGLSDTLAAERLILQASQDLTTSGSTGIKTISFSGAQGGGGANGRSYFSISLILRPLRILYSYQSGNYDSSSTWTQDPSVSLLIPTGGLTPLAGDSVIIKNGRTITLSADKDSTGLGLLLEEGAVLDLQSFTLDDLNSISGKGRLRSSRTNGAVAYFPTAFSNTNFLGADGGILEYYCNSSVALNTSVLTCKHLELRRESSGTTEYTLTTNLEIYGNLSLGRTGSAISRLVVGNSTTALSLNIGGDASIAAGCEWRVGAFDGNHAISINGNLSNYGSLRFTNQTVPDYASEPSTGTATLTFTGAANATLLCYGKTDLYRLIVNKGTGQTYILSVESNDSTYFELFGTNDLTNNPSADPNPVVQKALSLQNGTLKLNENIYIPCLSTGGDDFFIPQSAGLWINGAHVVATTGTGSNTGITVIGLLRMSSGRIETGNSSGLLYRVNAGLTIEGGYLHTAQLCPAATGAHYLAYSQSGGHVVIEGTTENTGFARFSLLYTNCSFNQSGGLLEIKYPVNRTGTDINLIEINSSLQNFSSTGGQINAVSNRTAELAHFYVSGSLYSLNFSNAGGDAFVSHGALSVNNSLLLDQGSPSLDMADFNLNINGNLNIVTGAALDMGLGTLTFGGSSKQLFTLDGSLTGNLQNLSINKSDTLELAGTASSFVVNADFSLLNGVLNDGGKTLDLRGNLTLSSIHTGTGKILLSTATTRTLGGNGSGVVNNLEFNSSGDATVTFSSNLKIKGQLEFIGTARRVLDLASFNLTFDSFATVVNPGSNRFVRFNGLQSAGGMTKIYSNDSFAFPVGSGTGAVYDYTPARIYFTSSPTTYGSITVKPIATEHLAVTSASRSLTYHWKTSSSGFVLGSSEVVQEYDYLAADVVTGTDITEGNYVPARFDNGAVEWVVGSSTTVDTVNRTLTFTGITFPEIDGEYTAGDNDPSNPFGQIEIYYSRVNNGNWADVNTWTTNPDHTTVSPPGTIPNANTIMRIGNGTTIFHTIEVNTNGGNLGSLTIMEGSALDLNQTSGHNFGSIGGAADGGKGTIRIDRNGTSYTFPGGDFGDFLSAGSGTIEFYNSTTSAVTLPTTLSSYNKLIINAQSSGIINFPPIDLTLYDSLLITSTGTAACYLNPTNVALGDIVVEKSLLVADGILEIRSPGNSALRNYHVKGDIKIANGASLIAQANGSNLAHTLELEGSLVNDGTLDLFGTSSRYVSLHFTGTDTAWFTGTNTNASTDIYKITLNKGSNKLSMLVLDVAGTLTTQTSDWLTLTNGTFRFAKAGTTLTVWDNSGTFSIPATAALSLNHSTATMNLAQNSSNGTDLLLSGRLEVLVGTINVGNTANNRNNDIEYSSSGIPEIIISGGTLNVNGQIRRSTSGTSGSLYYKQSGGSVVNVYGRSYDDSRGMLEVVNSGSFFGMSDSSSLYITQSGSVTFPDLYLNPASASVTGGTIYFQPKSPTTGNQSYTLNSTIPLYSVAVVPDGANTSTLNLNTNGLTLGGNLQINANGTLVTNSLALRIAGRFQKSGTYTGGNSVLTFTGTNSAIEGDFSSQTIYQLALDSSSILSLSGSGTSLQITNQLTINSGAILHDSSHLIDLKGAMTNNGEHRSLSNSASNTLQFTGSSAQTVTGSGVFGNLVVNNGNTVNLQGATQINRQLTLTNGSLTIGEYRLTLEETATVSGNFGASQHIRTNGVLSDAGIMKKCPSGANNLYFPLGLSGKFTPARINITSSDASGTVTLRLVNAKHPSTRLLGDSQLNLYWSVDTTGFNNLTVTHTYEYVDADVGGPEATYVGGRYVSPNWTPVLGISGTVNTTSNTITLSNVEYINGSFSAGSPGEFGSGNTYYSRKTSGDWDDLDMWSITGHNGAALSSASELPNGSPIIIASGDTVLVSGNSKLAETVTLLGQAVLDLGNTYAHNLGVVSGTGTLRIKATAGGQFLFPAGTFTAFTSASGGTVEFYGATNGTLPTRTEYNNLLFSDAATKTQSNVNVTVNGLFRIQAGVLSNTSFNKNITLKKNWVNDVGATGYVPGQGKVLFASDSAQSLDGISRFYSLEFSGAGNKTLLDSISVGYQLLMNGGLVYLGSNNLFIDSLATSSGSPSNTAMVIQNGSGRIVKRYKNTSPAFVFPIGEETGTREYSPVTLSFSSGTFSSQAFVSVMVYDSATPTCAGGSHSITRYWSFTHSGISAFNATAMATYKVADIVGTESLIGARMSRPSLPCVNGSVTDTSTHTLTFTGSVLNFLSGGEAPAAQPTIQASFLFFTQISASQMKLTWTKGNGQGRIVLAKQGAAVSVNPTDLIEYSVDTNFSGSPQDLGSNNFAVYQGTDSSFTLTGLSPEVVYHFAIYEYTNQGTERDYLITNPLVGVMQTLDMEPTLTATGVNFQHIRHTSIHVEWTGGNGTNKLLIARKNAPVILVPEDRQTYSANPVMGQGFNFGNDQFAVYSGELDSVTLVGLDQNSQYHFALFEWNGTDTTTNYLNATHFADSQHTYLLLEMHVLLEGTYLNGFMKTDIQANIPVHQPYGTAPYSFNDFDSLFVLPADSIVDWAFIELRKSPSASTAGASTIRGKALGFIRPDGSIDDTAAAPGILVKTSEPGEFFVVVHHRTHVSIMSSTYLNEPDSTHPYYSYDFTDSASKAYGTNALVSLGNGKWGMYAGRAENIGSPQTIDTDDRLKVWEDRNQYGYVQTDVTLDGNVDAQDRSQVWNNRDIASQVPQ
ncbi:MAG TPA: hypothetical protein DIW47_13370 [Bacteroidetes bacterium]|nr:hypothetical protein [Bacteroidota bacterium]